MLPVDQAWLFNPKYVSFSSMNTLKERVDNLLSWLYGEHSAWQGRSWYVDLITCKASCHAKALWNLSYVLWKSPIKTSEHAATVECHSRSGYGGALVWRSGLGLELKQHMLLLYSHFVSLSRIYHNPFLPSTLLFWMVLGIKPRVSLMLGKCPNTEPAAALALLFNFIKTISLRLPFSQCITLHCGMHVMLVVWVC